MQSVLGRSVPSVNTPQLIIKGINPEENSESICARSDDSVFPVIIFGDIPQTASKALASP